MLILAPLRGVTIRTFREVFAPVIAEGGFTEAITPFVAAIAGYDPLSDSELRSSPSPSASLSVTPQFIGKDPEALRICLERVKSAGITRADLNCGCPYPMVRSKGRGSGILRTPAVLAKMLEVGCEILGAGNFSMKARLGVERSDELLGLMPIVNSFPLRFLTVHARTARQMYSGTCDRAAFDKIAAVAKMPVVYNGDVSFPAAPSDASSALMIGRKFVEYLGTRPDIGDYLRRYVDRSAAELHGDNAVLGRMKELISYWRFLPEWHRRWNVVKLSRSVSELVSTLPSD